MNESDSNDLRWSCKPCKTSIPSLEKINTSLISLQKSNEDRMKKLELKVDRVEADISTKVKTEIHSMKEEIVSSIKDEVISLVDDRNKELDDRRRREKNIVFFNLQEGVSLVGLENKAEDETNVRTILSALGIDQLNIVTLFRLGKKGPNNRPLKVVLDSSQQRKFILNNAKFIGEKAEIQFKRVVISKDLTPIQREERRKRFRNVEQNSQRTREMEIEAPISPIERHVFANPINVVNNDTSGLNMFTDSRTVSPTNSVPPDNPFLTNTILEETVIGGLPSQPDTDTSRLVTQ